MPDRKSKVLAELVLDLFIFIVAVYILTSSGNNVYDTDASTSRYEVTKAMVERLELSIPTGLGLKGQDGRDYGWYGIGHSLMAVPFYFVGRVLGAPEDVVSLMNPLFGSATVVLIFLFGLSLGYSRRASIIVSIMCGLGTMVWPYSKHPFDHIQETFCILLSVYLMYRYTTSQSVFLVAFSAASLGVGFTIRYVPILMITGLFLMLLLSYRRKGFRASLNVITRDIIIFFLALLPFICVSLWYNFYRFGSVFETGFSLLNASAGSSLFEGMTATPFLQGFGGLLISPGKSIFLYSPVTLLFFFSIKPFFEKHFEVGVCFISILITYILFFSVNGHWNGDWAWGPRYILALTPFFMIPVSELLENRNPGNKRFAKVAVSFLFIVSVLIQLIGVSVDFKQYFYDLMVEKKVKFFVLDIPNGPDVRELPPGIYFDWNSSPILKQAESMVTIGRNLNRYRYSLPPENAPPALLLRMSPSANLFDFWWIYRYYLNGTFSGIIAAVVLLFLAVLSLGRVWRGLGDQR